MSASPTFTIELRRDVAWSGGVALLATAAAAAWLAWLRSVPASPGVLTTATLAALAVVAALQCAFASPPGRLRWDGRTWHYAPRGRAEREGDLRVMLDTGGWMLLRWREPQAPAWRRAAWMPVGRRGLGSAWNRLRAAVYSPRPASGDPAAADSATAPE